MIVAPLVLILLTIPGAGALPEVALLVKKLGADRYAEREHAADAIEALGPDALPALRLARAAHDAEVRSRVEVLLDKIEQAMLTRPTLVTIRPNGQPLARIVEEIAENHDFRLQLHAKDNQAATMERGDPDANSRLSFWSAIDRLGLSARWQGGASPDPFGASRPAVLHLYTELNDDRLVRDHGPFRVELRLVTTTDPAILGCKLNVLAEPLRRLKTNGPLRLTKAVDNLGHSLLRTESDRAQQPKGVVLAEPTSPALPRLALAETFDRPDPSATRLKNLRGTVAVEVSARRLEPRIISLDPPEAAFGQSLATDEHTFTIQRIQTDPNQGTTTLELTIQPRTSAVNPFQAGQRGFRTDFRPFEPDQLLDQLELVDAHDRPLHNLVNSRIRYDFRTQRLTLVFKASDEGGVPVQLWFHDVVRATTEVAFEFKDVPLP
ncbi:MAG: hypothetical protein ABI353_07245 [Isosphaeraceae bacterium]